MKDLGTRVSLVEQSVAELKHRSRNDRMIQMAVDEEVTQLSRTVSALKASVYAGISAACVLGPGLAWLMDRLMNN